MYLLFTYMARDVMILLRVNPLQGPLEGMGSENRDWTALCTEQFSDIYKVHKICLRDRKNSVVSRFVVQCSTDLSLPYIAIMNIGMINAQMANTQKIRLM